MRDRDKQKRARRVEIEEKKRRGERKRRKERRGVERENKEEQSYACGVLPSVFTVIHVYSEFSVSSGCSIHSWIPFQKSV